MHKKLYSYCYNKKYFVSVIILILFFIVSVVLSQIIEEMPFVGPTISRKRVKTFYPLSPPIIYKVEQIPQEVKNNQVVKIRANIRNNPARSKEITLYANLYYSTDNAKSFNKIEMEEVQSNIWEGEIPGFSTGTQVVYYLQAEDSGGNITTEMPSKNYIWPPTSEQEPILTQALIDKNNTGIPDDLDILEMAIGYNDEYFFGKLTLEGEVTEGTPYYIHGYFLGLVNEDRGETLLDSGASLIYAPLIQSLGGGLLGVSKDYFMIDKRLFYETKIIPYHEVDADIIIMNKNTLYWRCNREVIGSNPSNIIKYSCATAAATRVVFSLTELARNIIPCDTTPYICAYLRTHYYVVK